MSSLTFFQTLIICEGLYIKRGYVLPKIVMELINIYSHPRKWIDPHLFKLYKELLLSHNSQIIKHITCFRDILCLERVIESLSPSQLEINKIAITLKANIEFIKEPIHIYFEPAKFKSSYEDELTNAPIMGFKHPSFESILPEIAETLIEEITHTIEEKIVRGLVLLPGVSEDKSAKNYRRYYMRVLMGVIYHSWYWEELEKQFRIVFKDIGYTNIIEEEYKVFFQKIY